MMEAWEHIAPELPPGAFRRGEAFCWGQWTSATPAGLWKHFRWHSGITRKRHAELIAVERVREAARKKHPKCTVRLLDNAECWPQFDVLIFDRDLESWITVSCGSGPTLCDAAWACIQALGGGE